MVYRVILHKKAQRYYKKQRKNIRIRLTAAIEDLRTRENPRIGIHVGKLKGKLEGKYRYRVGNLRIIYEVHDEERTIRIAAIDDRGDVY